MSGALPTGTDAGGGASGAAGLELELPAVHSAGRLARHLMRPFAKSGGVAGSELDNLLLVLSELVSNAVDHGGGEGAVDEGTGTAARMRLSLCVDGGSWRLEVADQGGGDPDALRALISTNGLPDLEDERGRGFFLIAQLVDDIRVERTEDGLGLRLTCSRALPD